MTTLTVVGEPGPPGAATPAPPAAAPRRAAARATARVAAAVAAGTALLLAFPPYGVWPAAMVGVALLAAAVRGVRPRAGAGLGALAGLALFTPLLAWTNLHTGWTPWLLLSALQAGFLALLGAAAAATGPLLARRPGLWPLLTALLWTGQEALRDRLPFGGFPWGRLAFSQGDSPLLRLAALGGAPLVTFAVALAGGAVAYAVHRAVAARTGPATARRRGLLAAAGAAAAVLAGAAASAAVPTAAPAGAAVTVAVVQGNVPRLGLDFNAQRRAVLENHVAATLDLAARVRAGAAPRPDLVVWPENSSDIDPFRDTYAGQRITAAADAVGAPILIGAVLLDGESAAGTDRVRNAGVVWLPGSGAADSYTKRHPVPFAEYVPLRPLARMVSTQVDRVRSDFVAGDRPGVLRIGPATVGDVICFEVAYDSVVRDTVTGGAQLLVVQTNNATFDPAEARQQLAMVRLRAVEHGRDSMMASTVGVSAFVTADGRVHDATAFNTAAVIVREARLGQGRTLATRVGPAPEYLLVAGAVAALLAALRGRGRMRRAPVPPTAAVTAAVTVASGDDDPTERKTVGEA